MIKYKKENYLVLVVICTGALVVPYMLLNDMNDIARTLMLAVIAGILVINFSLRFLPEIQQYVVLLFCIRLILIIAFYHVGWQETLANGNAVYGYDPARFYYQANELLQNGFVLNAQINYAGIIYWYGVLFGIFGSNPIVPMIVNNLFSVLTGVLICCSLTDLLNAKLSNKKCVGIIVTFCCIPELIWYDCMSSRETVCMALLFFVGFIFNSTILFEKKIEPLYKGLCAIAMFLLGLIRVPFLLVAFVLLIIIVTMKQRSKGKVRDMVLVIGGMILLFVVLWASQLIGSTNTNISQLLGSAVSSDSLPDQYTWSSNSIGKMLIADSPLELMLVAPIRDLVYLITPLPNISIDVKGLAEASFGAWQGLWVLVSSVYYAVSIPYIFCTILYPLHRLGLRGSNITIVAWEFIAILTVVACGTQIIHERYRVTAIPWIFLAILLGKKATNMRHREGWSITIVVIVLGVTAYSFIKLI